MSLKDRTISVFGERFTQLAKTTDITKLPQWTDVDVIAVNCLLTEYHSLKKEKFEQVKEELLDKATTGNRLSREISECVIGKIIFKPAKKLKEI